MARHNFHSWPHLQSAIDTFVRLFLDSQIIGIRVEAEILGMQMNQHYISNDIYLKDEDPRPEFKGDPVINGEVTTYPGSRLPHVWLTGEIPSQKISTIDLSGHRGLHYFHWTWWNCLKDVAATVSQQLGVPNKAYGIGWGLDYHDKYRDWIKKREIADDGCLLV